MSERIVYKDEMDTSAARTSMDYADPYVAVMTTWHSGEYVVVTAAACVGPASACAMAEEIVFTNDAERLLDIVMGALTAAEDHHMVHDDGAGDGDDSNEDSDGAATQPCQYEQHGMHCVNRAIVRNIIDYARSIAGTLPSPAARRRLVFCPAIRA